MIDFKVFNKFNKITDLDKGLLELNFAKNALYSKFEINKKILHLFYSGTFGMNQFDFELDFTMYDKVFVDFSADDLMLRYEDIEHFIKLIKANEIYVISKNACEKDNWLYIDPLIYRITQLKFEIDKNNVKDYFYLGGHARYHRLLFLDKLNLLNDLKNISWSQRAVDESLIFLEIPYEFKDTYKELKIHSLLPKMLDIDNHNDAEYHNNTSDDYILNSVGVTANLDFYKNHIAEIISETLYYFTINPVKSDINFLNFSEKTFKPLSLGYPFISFNLPKSFSKIKEWGFELFDELFDYTFDNEYNDEKRMDMIINQINQSNLSEKYLNNFESIYNKHVFNKNKFIEFKKEMLLKYEKSLFL
jgi:hypothetical protein